MSRTALPGRMIAGLTLFLLLAALPPSATRAGDAPPAGKIFRQRPHRHDAVEIEARPILSRYSVSLIRPRRLIARKDGTLFIADWGGGTVMEVSPEGKASLLAQDLDEPAGLALDSAGNLYVSTYAQGMKGEGAVYRFTHDGMNRFTPDGMKLFAVGFSGPTDLAFDQQDNLYVANFVDNSISRVKESGSLETFVANIAAPSALLFDAAGNLLALSSTEGTVYRLSQMGVVPFARGLSAPTDLVLHPEGHVVAVDFGRGRLMHVTPKGALKLFAIVPRGTIAAEFDSLGNLVVANWDKTGLLKITTNLSIKCPHCGRKISVRLRTPTPKPVPSSEPKPMPPMI
jgi:DNA-directed RNA polymerase subunit RPC12/RpoP